jgi:hypothetical protein
VRQAQQTLAIASIVLAVLLVLGIRSLPSNLISSLNINQIAIIILVGIAILDAILLAIALASFKRSRLILS